MADIIIDISYKYVGRSPAKVHDSVPAGRRRPLAEAVARAYLDAHMRNVCDDSVWERAAIEKYAADHGLSADTARHEWWTCCSFRDEGGDWTVTAE